MDTLSLHVVFHVPFSDFDDRKEAWQTWSDRVRSAIASEKRRVIDQIALLTKAGRRVEIIGEDGDLFPTFSVLADADVLRDLIPLIEKVEGVESVIPEPIVELDDGPGLMEQQSG
jgi:hypothetical protein